MCYFNNTYNTPDNNFAAIRTVLFVHKAAVIAKTPVIK